MWKKSLVALVAVLLAIFLLAAGTGYLWLRQAFPQTGGTLDLVGLDGAVEVRRDEWGVPHIYASTRRDAYFAQGVVHAQDRLW
jgi:penicillin G amidase